MSLDQNVVRLNVIRLNVVRPNVNRGNGFRLNVVRPNIVRPNVVRPNVVRPNIVRRTAIVPLNRLVFYDLRRVVAFLYPRQGDYMSLRKNHPKCSPARFFQKTA
jgi:hypothetical protein